MDRLTAGWTTQKHDASEALPPSTGKGLNTGLKPYANTMTNITTANINSQEFVVKD